MNPYVEVKRCRTPRIMGDAAYIVLTRDSKTTTGNFFVDEEILRAEGATDFSVYAVQPGQSLQADYFLD
jgi:citronellol/citronellal dehydrogenase